MQKQTPEGFSRQLIKGKIGELVFDQMFRQASGYTVIPFGYESVVPSIAQYAGKNQSNLLEHIKNAPDFALVRHDPKEVRLVEVKYRTTVNFSDLQETAKRICDQWKHAWLFVATPDGFYFNLCSDMEELVELEPLSTDLVPEEVQAIYKNLILEFIS